MKIETEQEMLDFCKQVNSLSSLFEIKTVSHLSGKELSLWQDRLRQYDPVVGAQLKQGIKGIYIASTGNIIIEETPGIHPYCECPDYLKTKAITGVLVNCTDPSRQYVLLQLRGKGLDAGSFKFQGAAAGFGQFEIPLYQTALNELSEEAEINCPSMPFGRKAIAFIPFMVKEYPQPLAVFSFASDISKFPLCNDMKDIYSFAEETRSRIEEKIIPNREGYHFRVSINSLESIASAIQSRNQFHGPIADSLLYLKKYN
jgi:hypothetical protein